MASPLFTIVIPTRERPDTLRSCLRTCLAQDFDDYEVVVADNYGSPATAETIAEFASPRIRHVRSDRPLAMSANWENGVAAARGEYVTLIGDDDGFLPFALRELDRLVRMNDRPRAVHWRRGMYTWPSMTPAADANLLAFPLGRQTRVRRGRALIPEVMQFRVTVDTLPTIHSSVVHREVLEQLRQRAGRIFPSMYPDDFTSFALAWLCDEYLSVDVPMHISGVSHHSNGAATILRPAGDPLAAEFWRLNQACGIKPHPRVPDLPLPNVHVVDSFEWARELVFDRPVPDYDRRWIVEWYLRQIPADQDQVRERYREVIRASAADRPDVVEWIDQTPQYEPAPFPRLKPKNLGFDGAWIWLEAAEFGVADIAEATQVAASILGVADRPIEWQPERNDLPAEEETALTELRQKNKQLRRRCRELEARVASLERTPQAIRSMSRVFRRLRRIAVARRS